AQYGMLFSVYGMALAIFPFFLGRLSETMPKKPLIVLGSLLFSAMLVFMLAAPLYPLLIAGAALAGLGSAFVEPAMGSIYLGATTDENRGQVMGMRGSAISLAVMLVAEGIYTTKAALKLAERFNVEMPITYQLSQVLFEG